MRIVNDFNVSYAVLHDADEPTNSDGSKNSAWTENSKIQALATAGRVRLVASCPDFDQAAFGRKVGKDKAWAAYKKLREVPGAKETAEQVLDALLSPDVAPPSGFVADWRSPRI